MSRKIIIAGSIDFNNYEYLKEKANNILQDGDVIIIGGARGTDELALNMLTGSGGRS